MNLMQNNRKALKIAAAAAVLLAGATTIAFITATPVIGQTVRTRSLQDHFTLTSGSQIGIQIRDVESSDVTREKLASEAGAVVQEVRSDSPAATAGMKAGDVVVSYAGETIRSARQLSRLIEESPVGRAVDVVVMRNGTGARVTLKVTPKTADSAFGLDLSQLRGRLDRLDRIEPFHFDINPNLDADRLRRQIEQQIPRLQGQLRDFYYTSPGSWTSWTDRGRNRLGAGVQDLTSQLTEYFGAKDGVLVTSVEEGTAAKTAGLKAGDVITKVNDQAVASTGALLRELGSASGEATLTVIRDKKEQTIKVTLSGRTLRPAIIR